MMALGRGGGFQIKGRSCHQSHVGKAHDEEGTGKAVSCGQMLHQRPGQEGGKAEAHDGQPGGKAPVPGEILHQGGHRSDIAQPQANAADAAVKEIEKGQALQADCQGGAQHARAEESRSQEPAFPGADFFHETAQEACGHAQKQDGNGENPGDFPKPCVHSSHHGLGEHAPGVDAADGNMDTNGSQGDKPAISHREHPFLKERGAPARKRPSGQELLAQTVGL